MRKIFVPVMLLACAATAAAQNVSVSDAMTINHTAGAYLRKSSQTAGQGKFTVEVANTTRYVYYPMWVEPNSTTRYARVEYAVKGGLMSTTPLIRLREVILRAVPPEKWKPEPEPVELSRIRRQMRSVKEQDM